MRLPQIEQITDVLVSVDWLTFITFTSPAITFFSPKLIPLPAVFFEAGLTALSTGVPQITQNFALGCNTALQDLHFLITSSLVPHCSQNLDVSGFSVPQFEHFIYLLLSLIFL